MIGAFAFPAATAHMRSQVKAGFGINVSAKGAFMVALRAAVAACGGAVWFEDVSVHGIHGHWDDFFLLLVISNEGNAEKTFAIG